uniref:S1 motif domain-containing protein n=1 Tax=Amphora coffeiformis TaxID=265554 RepID=A0A7S3L6F6_9STRA|mmetsp:Transcript_16254/g.32641  ORF Transcript_16254/g.32641 Transcript_16254/m.32641 type:complete len:374 (+) Transcript_16254:75-1196(+)
MTFKAATVNALILSLGSAAAFTGQIPSAYMPRGVAVSQGTASVVQSSVHSVGCPCPACVGVHSAFCACGTCRRTVLFADASSEAEAVPEEVVALDGVESSEEAHNVERPARKTLKKKGPRGKDLSEFSVGDTVKAKVKTITNYGAFLDIGATTDGLLHISQLSVEFVSNVNEILSPGQEVDVRITGIDAAKNQVALSLLSEAQEEAAKEAAQASRGGGGGKRPQQQQQRRDDGTAIAALKQKGWSPEKFIEGTVVSTVDFGAFVRIDISQLNPEVEGEIDGLVHISALTAGRADSVTNYVNVDDKVQVRLKAIGDRNKISLTMVSVEDEKAKMEASGSAPVQMGNPEWRDAVAQIKEQMPEFKNGPVVVDLRK